MARVKPTTKDTAKDDQDDETTNEGPAESPNQDPLPPLKDPAPILEAKQVAVSHAAEREAMKVQQYRVVRACRVNLRGGFSTLQAGKLVDSRGYDLEGLKAQGVVLEKAGIV